LGDLTADKKIILKLFIKKIRDDVKCIHKASGQSQVAGSCDHGDKSFNSAKGGGCLEQLSD